MHERNLSAPIIRHEASETNNLVQLSTSYCNACIANSQATCLPFETFHSCDFTIIIGLALCLIHYRLCAVLDRSSASSWTRADGPRQIWVRRTAVRFNFCQRGFTVDTRITLQSIATWLREAELAWTGREVSKEFDTLKKRKAKPSIHRKQICGAQLSILLFTLFMIVDLWSEIQALDRAWYRTVQFHKFKGQSDLFLQV